MQRVRGGHLCNYCGIERSQDSEEQEKDILRQLQTLQGRRGETCGEVFGAGLTHGPSSRKRLMQSGGGYGRCNARPIARHSALPRYLQHESHRNCRRELGRASSVCESRPLLNAWFQRGGFQKKAVCDLFPTGG